ncbi:MAG TPA: SDR family NAD(P)-dependent oxidoreductase [Jatrophihabitans sp.]|jgi:NAD(P)-dependent dehydrogenase (short-subunit alcohol dehydrogenase family)
MTAGRFAGRRALITGSSYGIGANVADRLAELGADVVLCARTLTDDDRTALRPRSLAETAEHIGRHGTKVAYLQADLGEDSARADLVARAAAAIGGGIDILVNNAAAGIYRAPSTISPQHRRVTFEVNLEAPVDLSQAALPYMQQQGAGWIVNITSAAGDSIPPEQLGRTGPGGAARGIYGASKAALNRYTQALAEELGTAGVRVNAVGPDAAVLSDGARAKGGLENLPPEYIQSMESMVESIIDLCDCPPTLTGRILRSSQVAPALV